MRHQCSSRNVTRMTKRLSQIPPNFPVPPLSDHSSLKPEQWRRLVHKQIWDYHIKIHPRIYSGTIYSLLVVSYPVKMHSLYNSEPILTTLNNFLPPNGSKVYNSQSIAEEIFDPILECPCVLSHHKVISFHNNHLEEYYKQS